MMAFLLRLQLNRPLECADSLVKSPLTELAPAQEAVDVAASQTFGRQITQGLLRLDVATGLILYPSEALSVYEDWIEWNKASAVS